MSEAVSEAVSEVFGEASKPGGRVKVMPSGLVVSRKPAKLAETAGEKATRRGQVEGYSDGISRRLRDCLMSVDFSQVNWKRAAALTLTAREGHWWTAAEFQRDRQRFRKRLQRAGLIEGGIWIVEWHRHGWPHLHMVVFGVAGSVSEIVQVWLDVVGRENASVLAQHAKWVGSAGKWLKYLAKHGGRSDSHYQRQGSGPWGGSTGRMWGKWGQVKLAEPILLDVSAEDFYAARRVSGRFQLSMARGCGNPAQCGLRWDSRNTEVCRGMAKIKQRRRGIRQARKASRIKKRIKLVPDERERAQFNRAISEVRPVVVWRDDPDEFWSGLASLFPGLTERLRRGDSRIDVIPF